MRSSGFLQSPQVICLEASAGSGKTYALAKRYVQLSLYLASKHHTPIQSILAITFTNKATWAMKSRILDFLKRIALKKLSPTEANDILGPLQLPEQEASQIAFNLMNAVIRQYHYFQVQTIDSFVNILLVGCSFKIGLSARFKIQRNSKEYLQLSLDELLDQVDTDKNLRGLFEDFVRQYLFLENRSGWFPREDLLAVMAELFRQYNTYQKPLRVYLPGEDIFLRKKKVLDEMQQLKELCPAKTKKVFLDHLDKLLSDDREVFDLDELSNSWAKEEFPINKGGEVSVQLENLWNKLTKDIGGLAYLEAGSLFNPYVALFDRALERFVQLSRRDDVLFLEELNRKAASLFDDELISVEELYFRLAARFEHYLVDEFQDTSVSQWRNLMQMVEEALSHGGSLFYVGDKKQAIYAFRGGESRLFDALQIQLADFNVQVQNLDKNYRSCPEIIKFNNRIFSLENLEMFLHRRLDDAIENKRDEVHFSKEDFQIIANTFGHAHQDQGKDLRGGMARVVYLEGRTKQEREAQAREELIALIKNLQSRFALRDIAILTRGNQELEEITQWLLQEGIFASSERSSDLKNNPLITELMHLLAFLSSPIDNNAFAQFCLGELIVQATGLSAQTLRDFLFDCARRSKMIKEIYFYKEFQAAFPEVWEKFFEDFFRQVGISPLYELASGIICRLGAEKNFPQYQGFFMHWLELIKKQEKDNCDLSSFLTFYENLEGEERFVPMAQINAVKILTVHKAKGLEFPVVIIPFLEMDIHVGSGGRDGAQAYIMDIQDEGMSLVRIKESYRQFCPELQQRYEQEYKKAFLVELNSVYVAMTRAIEELYVYVPSRVGNTINPARFLIPEECIAVGTPLDKPISHESMERHQKIKPFMGETWQGLAEEFLNEPAVSALLARRGEFYHAILMHLGVLNEANAQALFKEAIDKALRLFPMMSIEITELEAFINRADVRPFFYLPDGAQVFCEKEFVNTYGDTKRMDRLIVLKDEVWVVDYKLSRAEQEQHQKQIQSYVELMRQFYPKHKVTGHVLYLT